MPRDARFDRLYLFFAACYLAQGLSGIIYEPLSYLLKDGLHLGPGQSAAFIWWMTLPMLIKPLFGLLSDIVPIRQRRRRPHMIAACLLWAGGLAALALFARPQYGLLLGLLTLVNVGLVAGDVVCDSVMVEQGQLRGKTGPYQSVQIAIVYASIVATGVGGGWLVTHAAPRAVFALAACFPALALAAVVWMREPAAPPPSAALGALSSTLKSTRFWAVSAVIFLWSFSPFLGTAQFYYQADALKLTPIQIGWLESLGGLTGAVGAALYGRLIGTWTLRQWLRAAVLLGTPLALSFLFYRGFASAMGVVALGGVVGVGFRLALMDLAARSCPKGAEAVTFAAYMSVFNLAASASNLAGARLLEALRARLPAYESYALLVLIGALCTAACWPLLEPALRGLRDDAARA